MTFKFLPLIKKSKTRSKDWLPYSKAKRKSISLLKISTRDTLTQPIANPSTANTTPNAASRNKTSTFNSLIIRWYKSHHSRVRIHKQPSTSFMLSRILLPFRHRWTRWSFMRRRLRLKPSLDGVIVIMCIVMRLGDEEDFSRCSLWFYVEVRIRTKRYRIPSSLTYIERLKNF